MSISLLPDRAILAISGEDAEGLLHRLFTRSILAMPDGTARFAALLSPQGKLLVDFFVVKRPDGYWIDAPRDLALDLAKKLTMFKLRSKVTIAATDLAVAASWGGALMDAPGSAFRDPRHDGLGYRIVAPASALAAIDDEREAYDAHRIALGVPQGGIDFVYGDTFVHDANLDLLHGVDFDKGCYVGQEVVSRVHHRNSARKRIVKLHFYGDPAPVGAALTVGTTRIGEVTSRAETEALANVRTDRLEEAASAALPVLAGETLVGITLPTASVVTAPNYAEDLY